MLPENISVRHLKASGWEPADNDSRYWYLRDGDGAYFTDTASGWHFFAPGGSDPYAYLYDPETNSYDHDALFDLAELTGFGGRPADGERISDLRDPADAYYEKASVSRRSFIRRVVLGMVGFYGLFRLYEYKTSAKRNLVTAGEPMDSCAGSLVEVAADGWTAGCYPSSEGYPGLEHVPSDVARWGAWIDEAAQKTNADRQLGGSSRLETQLIAAVVWVESRGDPSAYSRSGAVGLMQVMPRDGTAATIHCVNGPCFSSRPLIKELLNPAFNLSYGTDLLGGKVVRALSRGSTDPIRDALISYGPATGDDSYAKKVFSVMNSY